MFIKMTEPKRFKPVGRLRVFFALPFYIAVLLIDVKYSFIILLTFRRQQSCLYLWYFILPFIYICSWHKTGHYARYYRFFTNYSQVQRQLLYELSVPYCLLDTNGRVMWLNKAMCACINKKKDFKKNISTLFPEITCQHFPDRRRAEGSTHYV